MLRTRIVLCLPRYHVHLRKTGCSLQYIIANRCHGQNAARLEDGGFTSHCSSCQTRSCPTSCQSYVSSVEVHPSNALPFNSFNFLKAILNDAGSNSSRDDPQIYRAPAGRQLNQWR